MGRKKKEKKNEVIQELVVIKNKPNPVELFNKELQEYLESFINPDKRKLVNDYVTFLKGSDSRTNHMDFFREEQKKLKWINESIAMRIITEVGFILGKYGVELTDIKI